MLRIASSVLALTLCACASLPPKVANRPLVSGADPRGTWTLDGAGTELVIKAPRDNGQLFDVTVGGEMGKALSDGEFVYVAYPILPGSRIGLGVYERGAEGVEGVIGLYKLGWEKWSAKEAGKGFEGTFAISGFNPMGKSLSIPLGVRFAGSATDIYDLVWQGDASRFEGVGLESEGKLVVARWGVTVTKSGMNGGADGSITFTTTTENRERPQVWVGAYRINGDRLEGRVTNNDSKQVIQQAFSKAK